LGEGDFSSGFKIRELDQLQDLADIFNGSIANVRQKLNVLKEGFLSLKNKLDDIAQDEVSEHKRASINQIKKAADEVNKIISSFKS
jgi:methyl-accepting chemotaxis protein